ncbi:hypothetical protein FIE12Z_428 [Fusarium flagelliforme]|uniref:Uncharacterized protein n=1 Tax=Fusarium flagelliforme TaxID=2675880 RepID=A0A395N567_9HYPO|nr:hypothetical protein FIE12Z_428 [Fusarium flagelliforme]
MSSKTSSSFDPSSPCYINDIKIYHNGLPGPFRIESDNLDVRLKATVDSHGHISNIVFRNRKGEHPKDYIFVDRRGNLYFTGDVRLAQVVVVIMGLACEAVGVPERVSIMVSPEIGNQRASVR